MLTLLSPSISLAVVLAAAPAVETPAAPVAPVAAGAAWIEETLAAMTLREKAAQLVMSWIPGGAVTRPAELARLENLVLTHKVGGFIVGRGAAAGTRRTLARLQSLSEVPLVVGADVERGAGMRLVGETMLASQMAIGATGDPELAYRQGLATARESRSAGIHIAFSPVADVNIDPRNPIINTRAFGSEPAAVARMVQAYARGLQQGGMLAVAKHFPGHGDTHTDSHLALPLVGASRARLDSVELVPFRAGVDAGIDGVMSAHIAVPALSGNRTPATLSHAILTGLLRDEMGFDGLIITDALNMAAVTRHAEPVEIILGAVQAGADILLQPGDPELAIDVLVEAVQRGDLREARLDASVRRVLGAKAKLGLHLPSPSTPAASPAELRAFSRSVAEEIAERSITLVRDEPARVPVRGTRAAVWIHYTGSGSSGALALDDALRAAGWTVEAFRLRRTSTAAQVAAAERAATRAGRFVILSSSTQAVPWEGTTSLSPRFSGLVKRMSAAGPVVYVSFGDPYLLASFPLLSTYLLGWSDSEIVQHAAARALTGQRAVTATLPIDLPPHYEAGFGLVRAPLSAR